MDLPWKAEEGSTLSYEKKFLAVRKICYYVTDNPENPHPETLVEEAALAVIDQFDPRAGAIHLIYCAEVANLDKPWSDDFFVIDDGNYLNTQVSSNVGTYAGMNSWKFCITSYVSSGTSLCMA